MMKFGATIAAGVLAASVSSQAFALTFGVFGASTAFGIESSLSLIVTQAGHAASVLDDLSMASLGGVDVLWILNGDIGAQPVVMTANAASLSAFVQGGGLLLYHDRNIDQAAATLPGGAGISFVLDDALTDTASINVLDGSTLVTDGPGGVIDSDALDGGNQSNHGYAQAGTLPAGVAIFSRTSADEAVDFGYALGLGFVYYSTIPLDYYLGGGGPNPPADAFLDIYAPNLVAYAASLLEAPSVPAPEPAMLLLLGGGLLGLGLSRRRR